MSLILNGTDGLSDVDGSASTPAIRGTDANTGIFFPAADTIAFAEGGAEVARFDSSGNLGIGTSSPDGKLKVVASGANLIIGFSGTQNYFDASENIFRNFAGTERMRIDSSGNVKLSTANTSILNSSGNPILRQTGSVLQVVSATKTNTASTTSTTPVDTGLELTITPVSSTSKILLMTTVMASQSAIKRIYFRFAGGNSSAAVGDANTGHEATFSINSRSGDSYIMLPGCASYLDSPATTSAITYKIQWWVESDTGYLNRPGTIDANGANTVSTITAMEIAA